MFDTGRYSEDGHIHQDILTSVVSYLLGTAKGFKKKVFEVPPLAGLKLFSRRSAVTAWVEHLKVEFHVIECILNHQSPINHSIISSPPVLISPRVKKVLN